MRPVDQTLFGATSAPQDQIGNCYPACIATLLEVPLEDVPHVYQLHHDDPVAAHAVRDQWLAQHGLAILSLDLKSLAAAHEATWRALVGVLGIFSGGSPRHDCTHAVVGRLTADLLGLNWELVHDPHPERQGIKGYAHSVEVFMRIDPALGMYGRAAARLLQENRLLTKSMGLPASAVMYDLPVAVRENYVRVPTDLLRKLGAPPVRGEFLVPDRAHALAELRALLQDHDHA